MALIDQEVGGRISFYPFCSNEFTKIAKECVGCEHAVNAGLALISNGSLQYPLFGRLCNPQIEEYPLPLYKCSVCNRSFLDAVLSFIIIVSILTISASFWSILVWFQKQKRPQILFKLSLAFSDFLFGAILLPFVAAHLIDTMYLPHEEYFDFSIYLDQIGNVDKYEQNWVDLFSPFHNRIIAFVLFLSQGASLCSVLLLNIDRHIAITYHLKYYQIMSKKKSIFILVFMWLAVSGVGLATTFSCGAYLTKPFALFLPIVEPETEKKELLQVLVFYLLPLGLVFCASCLIALCTSIKLYKLSKSDVVHYFDSRSSKASIGKTSILRLQQFSMSCLENKSSKINNNDKQEKNEDEEQTQIISDCNSTCLVDSKFGAAKEKTIIDTGVPQGHEPARTALVEEMNATKPTSDNAKQLVNRSSTNDSPASQRNEYKSATRTLMLILASYALCVLPLTCLLVTYLIDEHIRHEKEHVEEPFNKAILDGFAVAVGIFMLSSLRNCIIYSVRNREYRASSKMLWRHIVRKFCSN